MSCLEFSLNCRKIIGRHRPARKAVWRNPARTVGWQGPVHLLPRAVLWRLVASWYVETTLGGMKEMLNGPSSSFFPGSEFLTHTGASFLRPQKACYRRERGVIGQSPGSRCDGHVAVWLAAVPGGRTAPWPRATLIRWPVSAA